MQLIQLTCLQETMNNFVALILLLLVTMIGYSARGVNKNNFQQRYSHSGHFDNESTRRGLLESAVEALVKETNKQIDSVNPLHDPKLPFK